MWSHARLCKFQKGCSRLATASDKVYQLLAHGRLFSPGTTASSSTKTGRHDIAEILLKVALNTKNQNQSNHTIISLVLCIKSYNTHLYYTQLYLKEALATILTKKIICFGNW